MATAATTINITTKLQWGHDKIVMEVKLRLRSLNKVRQLQWGHDKIVMEVIFRAFTIS